jgi:hypothetical protein
MLSGCNPDLYTLISATHVVLQAIVAAFRVAKYTSRLFRLRRLAAGRLVIRLLPREVLLLFGRNRLLYNKPFLQPRF